MKKTEWENAKDARLNYAVIFREGLSVWSDTVLEWGPIYWNQGPLLGHLQEIDRKPLTKLDTEDTWKVYVFRERKNAISFAKKLEGDQKWRQLASRSSREDAKAQSFMSYLELYAENKYGNVFWDYPRTVPRSISSFFVSTSAWENSGWLWSEPKASNTIP